jgi:hypothetical protein
MAERDLAADLAVNVFGSEDPFRRDAIDYGLSVGSPASSWLLLAQI